MRYASILLSVAACVAISTNAQDPNSTTHSNERRGLRDRFQRRKEQSNGFSKGPFKQNKSPKVMIPVAVKPVAPITGILVPATSHTHQKNQTGQNTTSSSHPAAPGPAVAAQVVPVQPVAAVAVIQSAPHPPSPPPSPPSTQPPQGMPPSPPITMQRVQLQTQPSVPVTGGSSFGLPSIDPATLKQIAKTAAPYVKHVIKLKKKLDEKKKHEQQQQQQQEQQQQQQPVQEGTPLPIQDQPQDQQEQQQQEEEQEEQEEQILVMDDPSTPQNETLLGVSEGETVIVDGEVEVDNFDQVQGVILNTNATGTNGTMNGTDLHAGNVTAMTNGTNSTLGEGGIVLVELPVNGTTEPPK